MGLAEDKLWWMINIIKIYNNDILFKDDELNNIPIRINDIIDINYSNKNKGIEKWKSKKKKIVP